MMLTSLLLAVSVAQAVPPPRDAAAPGAKGTAVIRGRVVAAEGERPLRRAQVRIHAGGGPEPRVASTNTQGLFEIRDVPAGRYRLTVTRSGYLPGAYGQRYPDEAAIPVEVADGQLVENVNVALLRAGVIGGRVTDETGDAVAGVNIWAMQPRFFRGRRRLVPAGSSARTDDTGQYRLLSLAPGDYVVMASLRETWTSRGKEKVVLAYAPSYFGATTSPADAQRVKVGVGQEVGAVDISLIPGRVAKVSGTVTRADGSPLPNASVGLSQNMIGPMGGMVSSIADARAAADGTWMLRDVPPGEFEIEASSSDPAHKGERALGTISVAGSDLEGIALVVGASATISGRIVTDTGGPLPPNRPVRVVGAESVEPDAPQMLQVIGDPNGVIGADGRFEIARVPPGRIMLRTAPPAGWAIARINVGGKDHSETPIEVRSGDRISGVEIVLTDTFPEFTGRMTDDAGNPAHGTVLLFPADAGRWFEAAGTLRSARAGQGGAFRIDDVRPGRYLAIALDYVAEWQAADPEFLARVRAQAQPVTIGPEQPEAVELKIQKDVR